MAWTTFANLTGATGAELDGNFSLLSYCININCSVTGQNSLALSSNTGAVVYAQYQPGMTLNAIAIATNTGSVVAALNPLPSLNVYKDSAFGPVLLSGGEIVQLCAFALVYDATLNSNAGGWHLQSTTSGILNGASLASLNVGLLGAGSLNAGTFALGQIVFGTVTATVGTIQNLLAGTGSLASLIVGTGAPLLRMNSILASAVFTVNLVPGVSSDQTLTFAGVQPYDNIILGWSLAPTASIVFSAWAPATGSVVMRAFNPLSAATISLNTLNMRLTNLGWT